MAWDLVRLCNESKGGPYDQYGVLSSVEEAVCILQDAANDADAWAEEMAAANQETDRYDIARASYFDIMKQQVPAQVTNAELRLWLSDLADLERRRGNYAVPDALDETVSKLTASILENS